MAVAEIPASAWSVASALSPPCSDRVARPVGRVNSTFRSKTRAVTPGAMAANPICCMAVIFSTIILLYSSGEHRPVAAMAVPEGQVL